MNPVTTKHGSFTIERTYSASPERVFNAWADPKSKLAWYKCDDAWVQSGHQFDFRPGGRERLASTPPGGLPHVFEALYYDIVPNRRIIYSYDLLIGTKRLSASLATIELEPHGSGTRLTFTEQSAFLDGYDDFAGREHGTREGLDNLALWIESAVSV